MRFALAAAARRLTDWRVDPDGGPRCHELRVVDDAKTWRIAYRIDRDTIVVADVFQKSTQQTPVRVLADRRRRLRLYDQMSREAEQWT